MSQYLRVQRALGRYIRERRGPATQRVLSDQAGINAATWSRLENGLIRWPDDRLLMRIAIVLGVPANDLMRLRGEGQVELPPAVTESSPNGDVVPMLLARFGWSRLGVAEALLRGELTPFEEELVHLLVNDIILDAAKFRVAHCPKRPRKK